MFKLAVEGTSAGMVKIEASSKNLHLSVFESIVELMESEVDEEVLILPEEGPGKKLDNINTHNAQRNHSACQIRNCCMLRL